MDLTEVELFKNVLEIKSGTLHIDLHNDFTCINLDHIGEDLTLKFQHDKGDGHVMLQFKKVEVLKMQLPLQFEGLTLDNFHRGRFSYEDDNCNGKMFFYVETIEDGIFEI